MLKHICKSFWTISAIWKVTITKFHRALCCIGAWHTLFCLFPGRLEGFRLITTPWSDRIISIHCLLENAFWKNLPLKFLVLRLSPKLCEEHFWTCHLWWAAKPKKMETSEFINQVLDVYVKSLSFVHRQRIHFLHLQ